MDSYKIYQSKADKHIKTAEHLLTVTLPLIKDQKLIPAAIENMFLALENTITALLEFELLYKKIPPFQDNFDSKFNMLRAKLIPQLELDESYIKLIEDVKTIIDEHKKSSFKFTKDEMVISSEGFRFKTLNNAQIKEMINKTKDFISEIDKILIQK